MLVSHETIRAWLNYTLGGGEMTRKFKSPGELMIFFPPPPIFITPSNSNDTRVALIKISFRLETFNRVQSRPNSVEAGRRRRRRKEERK